MKPHYVPVYKALGIDSLINPRLLAAAQILRLTRREEVVSLSILQDEKAEVVEVVIPETAKVVNHKIANAGFSRGMLIGSLIRNGHVIVPNGDTILQADDHLIIFSLPKVGAKLERFFAPQENNGSREQLRNKLFLAE